MKTTQGDYTVLIVDDDEDLCRLLKASLPAGLSVHIEHSLSMAEAYLCDHKPSLLFLDNTLPDGRGLSFIKQAINLGRDIKVIMMTSDTGSGIREEALRQGACYFISKPFRISLVKDIVLSIFPNLSAA
jgi:DNA-binding NtrC family response regulator